MARKSTKALKRIVRGTIPYYVYKVFNPNSERLQYLKYIKDYGDAHHLFTFSHEYDDFHPTIYNDDASGLPYVILPESNRRLYFYRNMPPDKVSGLYKVLLMEQDKRSPHRYFDNIEEFSGKTLVDVGAAEGILSLMAIGQVEHVYIFECEDRWIEALENTFRPWKEKVTIIQKKVGAEDAGHTVRLDSYFTDKPHSQLFLKMDIEGMERFALKGSESLFSETGNMQFAICTYHEEDDYNVISSYLDRFHCQYKEQKGYFRHKIRSVMLRGHN